MDIGPTELIIILIIVVLVFGVGRVGKLGGELGNAIREFRQGLNAGDKEQQPQGAAKAPDAPAAAPVEAATQTKPTETPEG
jgi:sec-independent protein translocase protein TatA